jgi:hypothetical protein
MKWVLQRTCLSAINILFGICRPCTWIVLFYTTLYNIVYSARRWLTVSSVSTVSPCQFVLSFTEAQSARVNTTKKKKKKTCASRWIHKKACTQNIYAHWIRAIHNIKTLQHWTSTCRGCSCLKNKPTKRTNITRASIQLFRLSAQWQNSSMLEIKVNRRTRNSS